MAGCWLIHANSLVREGEKMKKNKFALITLLLTIVGLSGCNKNTIDTLVNDFSVTSVSLDQSYAKLEAEETIQLNATIKYKDDKEVDCYKEWRSSNMKIATVSENGLVTALKPGSASITFIAGFKSASCSITVPGNDSYIPVTPDESGETSFSISLNEESLTLGVNDSFKLVASTSTQASVTWTSSNDAIASVDENGLVLANAEGEVTITATANGVNATCEISVVDGSGDDVQPSDELSVHVYFFIDYNNVDEDDATGKKLLAKFWWYEDRPIGESGKVPANPTQAPISAFPYFAGWSDHPIVDSKDGLIDLNTYSVSGRPYIYIFGIWTDVQGGMQL